MINSIKNFWFNLSDKIRFLFVGGFNFCVAILILMILITILRKTHYQACNVLAWFLSSFVSFTTQKLLVFNVKGNIIKQYLKCSLTWMCSCVLNGILLEIFVKYLSMDARISQIIANFLVAVFTYIMFKVFAFKKKSN